MTKKELTQIKRTVIDNPDVEDLALIYADAMEESGLGRWANFVRNCPEYSRTTSGLQPRWFSPKGEFDRRLFPFIYHVKKTDERVYRNDWRDYVVRKGFVREVLAGYGYFVKHGHELLEHWPIVKFSEYTRRPVSVLRPGIHFEFLSTGRCNSLSRELRRFADDDLIFFDTERQGTEWLEKVLLQHAKDKLKEKKG